MRFSAYIFLIAVVLTPFLFGSCSESETVRIMDRAESLMEEHPDSALNLLTRIDGSAIGGRKEQARHALLMSMALDKNYIDTTTFDVLQPAIDYYRAHGNPDEKLRTYYYQGRIYQNRGDDDLAMLSFMNARDNKNQINDSILLAHNYVAMGTLYFKQYKIDQFIKTNIEAAKLYGIKNRHIPEIKSYANALDGYIILNDKQLADSVMSICTGLVKINPELAEHLHSSFISYIIEFGTPEETKVILEELEDSELESEDIPNIAKAYTKLGHYDKAHKFITSQKTEGSILDSLKYLSIETMILEKQGKFESALSLFRKYSSMLERYQYHLMSQDLMFAEERHQSELNTMANLHDKDKIIYWSLCVAFAMLLLTCWLYYSYRLLKSRRVITEKENENLRLEKVNLLTQKENAELERDKKILEADNLEKDRRHLEAEQRQKILENENLRLELERIEGERDSLKELIKDRPSLDPSLREVIKNRLTILNSLLAKEITNVEKYAGPYKKLIEAAKVDKEEFINSTRLVYTVSHPNFMAYLTSLGLSINELNYLSLYAMGIRGKEVGQYVNLKRHYNVSSDIRKKLGINEHETNLGKYIQRLMEELDPPLRPSKPVC